jgi:2-methylcitrate dehydratase PrpD
MITETLARFVTETRTASISDDVLGRARDALIDTLGVALAGTQEPAARLAVRWVAENGSKPQASIWGSDHMFSAADAAFANGVASHALDFDDSHPSLRSHPDTTLVPTALAVGEAMHAPGADVLAACVIGLEIAGKLGRAMGQGHIMRGWHITSTVGVLASTAVAARLMGLDAKILQRAWGISASQMSGLLRNFGTMAKPYHAGQAAYSAVRAAWLAKNGFTADETIFDGKGSAIEIYRGEDGEAIAELVNSLGKPWEIVEPGTYVKRWPCCYSNHRAIGGLIELIKKHGIRADEVSEVAVGFLPGGDASLVSEQPTTGLQGKFSVEYVLAVILREGRLGLETFTDENVHRPEVIALMKKVRRYSIPDDKFYSGISGYTDVAVTTKRGRFEMRVDRVPGSPAWPLTREERNEKFLDCAKRVLGEAGTQKLAALCERAQTLSDVRELVRATVPS